MSMSEQRPLRRLCAHIIRDLNEEKSITDTEYFWLCETREARKRKEFLASVLKVLSMGTSLSAGGGRNNILVHMRKSGFLTQMPRITLAF